MRVVLGTVASMSCTGGHVATQRLAPHDPRPYVTVRNTQQIDTVQFLLSLEQSRSAERPSEEGSCFTTRWYFSLSP